MDYRQPSKLRGESGSEVVVHEIKAFLHEHQISQLTRNRPVEAIKRNGVKLCQVFVSEWRMYVVEQNVPAVYVVVVTAEVELFVHHG
jgi:hypothetical protein